MTFKKFIINIFNILLLQIGNKISTIIPKRPFLLILIKKLENPLKAI